jgi:hypothetical protein
MVARYAAFRASDVENPFPQVKLLPAGLQAFLYTQAVREQQKDEGRIAMTVPVLSGSLNKSLYLPGQEVLPLSGAPNCHCSRFDGWSCDFHVQNLPISG